ncbi:MAG TPA: cytochrome o ubiquinol oxidase subunit IV [Stellaceae bacterium]|nr:cytochrome o ubiquinol oxidase subunit IV [Stellaceae bacterium]
MEQALHDPAGHGGSASRRAYLTGFALAVVLTALPFALVIERPVSSAATLAGIFAAAILQILVHLRCFLHLEWTVEGRWNVLAFVFTILIIGIVVGGSIWIMFNLQARTMLPSLGTMTMSAAPR